MLSGTRRDKGSGGVFTSALIVIPVSWAKSYSTVTTTPTNLHFQSVLCCNFSTKTYTELEFHSFSKKNWRKKKTWAIFAVLSTTTNHQIAKPMQDCWRFLQFSEFSLDRRQRPEGTRERHRGLLRGGLPAEPCPDTLGTRVEDVWITSRTRLAEV